MARDSVDAERGAGPPRSIEPTRRSVAEVNAYRALRNSLADLHRAEQTLADLERVTPDPGRAERLGKIRTILAQFETVARTLPTH